MRPECVSWLIRETSEVGVVDDKCCEVSDGRHDALDHSPAERTAVSGTRLVDDGTNTVRPDDGPDEESNARGRYEVSLDGEQVTNLVDREPDGRQREEPKKEEGRKGLRGRARACRQAVWDVIPAWPDRADHKVDAFASDP